MTALVEAQENRGELDQFTRRSEDDDDHGAERRCFDEVLMSARPRHIPAPWATA